jgi:hypothetical protein
MSHTDRNVFHIKESARQLLRPSDKPYLISQIIEKENLQWVLQTLTPRDRLDADFERK